MDPRLHRAFTTAVAVGCFVLIYTAFGQQQSDQQEMDSASGGASAQQQAQQKTEAIAKGYRASRIIGATVKNDQGERIGRIEDVIVSPDGKVAMAVVEVGAYLGSGDRRVAIPVERFQTFAPDAILPGANRSALRNLPEFQYARA